MKRLNVTAIILAGGVGSRMMSDIPKQHIEVLGESVLLRTVKAFDKSNLVTDIIVVSKLEEMDRVLLDLTGKTEKPCKVVVGGKCRAESAFNGFNSTSNTTDFIALHDAARCLITPTMIDKVIKNAIDFGAATAVCTVSDTVKITDNLGRIKATLPRNNVVRAQTPQVFSYDVYKKAIDSIDMPLSEITDDNMIVEAIGTDIVCVDLGNENIKITTQDDLLYAEFILTKRGDYNV